MRDLTGKAALVTGGASGIGAACVRQFVERGAQVMIADRSADLAEALVAELGDAVSWVETDVANIDSARGMVEATVAKFGGLDIAVNNAGVGAGGSYPTAELDPEIWDRVIRINLDGVFFCMRAELPALQARGGGSIVNVASIMGTVANPGSSAYVASKHGVVGLTKATALEYADAGIRVNSVGPGYVKTPLIGDRAESQDLIDKHPIGRLSEPEEIAKVIGFLAGPDSSFVTGSYYIVDGGFTAR